MKHEFVIIKDKKLVATFTIDHEGTGLDFQAVETFKRGGWRSSYLLYEVEKTYRQIHPKSTATYEPKSLVLSE